MSSFVLPYCGLFTVFWCRVRVAVYGYGLRCMVRVRAKIRVSGRVRVRC